jgi:hypothetical protein
VRTRRATSSTSAARSDPIGARCCSIGRARNATFRLRPAPGTESGDPIRWRGDGKVLFTRQGKLPARVFALDVTTGQRTLMYEISPRDTVGVDQIGDIRLTPDGKSYAYVFIQNLYSLYQLTGMK